MIFVAKLNFGPGPAKNKKKKCYATESPHGRDAIASYTVTYTMIITVGTQQTAERRFRKQISGDIQ